MAKNSTANLQRVDRNIVRKVKRNEANSDFEYWQSQPFEKRLEALETIRQEYDRWKYDTEPGFHRVYRIVKRS
jgi:hypothetical protein